jgi:hypothetical protein
MEGLDFDLPEGFFTPEEMVRFTKLKSDAVAFQEKHGDHMSWLLQTHDAGLISAEPLTPDDRQYLDEVAKVTQADRELFERIEGFDDLEAAQERYQTMLYLKNELRWFTDLVSAKRIEIGKRLLKGLERMLKNMIKHSIEHPEDEEVKEDIVEVKATIAKFTHETTASALNLAARQPESDN